VASLATPAMLGAFMQQPLAADDATALLMLDIASGMARDYLHAQLDAVANDVVLLDPINGAYVLLPELPVTAITLLETFDGTVWTTVLPAMYSASKALGMIAAKPATGLQWPGDPESWRVTYSHGFATIPSTIVGMVLGSAARAYSSPAGVDMEKIGGYTVKYSMETGGFTAAEQKAVARYVNPRIA